jgi:hypothetical protein
MGGGDWVKRQREGTGRRMEKEWDEVIAEGRRDGGGTEK